MVFLLLKIVIKSPKHLLTQQSVCSQGSAFSIALTDNRQQELNSGYLLLTDQNKHVLLRTASQRFLKWLKSET